MEAHGHDHHDLGGLAHGVDVPVADRGQGDHREAQGVRAGLQPLELSRCGGHRVEGQRNRGHRHRE